MYKDVRTPLDVALLFTGLALLAFSLVTFLLFTHIMLLPLASLFIPVLTTTLPLFLDDLTNWVGLDVTVFRSDELFATLSARFTVIGTTLLTSFFLLRPPKRLINRNAAENFSTPEVVSLRWYAVLFVGFMLLGGLLGAGDAPPEALSIDERLFHNLAVVCGYTAVLLLIHCLVVYILLAFWNFGCVLVHPYLRDV